MRHAENINFATREDWLAYRKDKIGASEAAIAVGLNPYQSPYELWLVKTGQGEPDPGIEDKIAVRAGHFMEPFIASLYQEETGEALMSEGAHVVYPHKSIPYLFATPDWITAKRKPVELKCLGDRTGMEYVKGHTNDSHFIQLQIQMACLGSDNGALAVLVGNREFVVTQFERDDEVLSDLSELLEHFMECVKVGTPPPATWHESCKRAISRRYPTDNEQRITLPDDADLAVGHLISLKEQIKMLERDKAELENQVRLWMADNAYGDTDTYEVSLKAQTRKNDIVVCKTPENIKALTAADIAFVANEDSTFRVLRHKVKKQTKEI